MGERAALGTYRMQSKANVNRGGGTASKANLLEKKKTAEDTKVKARGRSNVSREGTDSKFALLRCV